MYNDPTRYQRSGQPSPQQSYDQTRPATPQFPSGPYDQTRPAAPQFQAAPQGQQNFYQQPPMSAQQPPFAGAPAQNATPSARKGGIFADIGLKPALVAGGIIVAMLALIIGVAVVAAQANSATSVVNSYYTAVKQQNYSKADSYILFPETTGSQGARLYMFVAQGYDKSHGPVTDYHIQSQTSDGKTATVVESVQRQSTSYTVRLTLMYTNGMWKITSFTAI